MEDELEDEDNDDDGTEDLNPVMDNTNNINIDIDSR